MSISKLSDFYNYYNHFKSYETPVIKKKHLRWYDREYWYPANASIETSVLELGSGTGEFLCYLSSKGVKRFNGVERDAQAVDVMPEELKPLITIADIWDYLDKFDDISAFDHVVMLDVLEHFSVVEGSKILIKLREILVPQGLVILRLPNMGSPWGSIYQFSDLTHLSSYTPNSLEQLAGASGYNILSFYPQIRGSWLRVWRQNILHNILSWMLITKPVIWTPNMIAILQKV